MDYSSSRYPGSMPRGIAKRSVNGSTLLDKQGVQRTPFHTDCSVLHLSTSHAHNRVSRRPYSAARRIQRLTERKWEMNSAPALKPGGCSHECVLTSGATQCCVVNKVDDSGGGFVPLRSI
eukprot:GFKZ01014236.1.p1 GENE.GFKZ01014236.1~~GFKZ01014236.1.p1  ORF type:complete len:120 (+),score=3.21 GFKZ01014236.1:217-576(+)